MGLLELARVVLTFASPVLSRLILDYLNGAAASEGPATLPDDRAPSASLDHLQARAAPTQPGAPPERAWRLAVASAARLGPLHITGARPP